MFIKNQGFYSYKNRKSALYEEITVNKLDERSDKVFWDGPSKPTSNSLYWYTSTCTYMYV